MIEPLIENAPDPRLPVRIGQIVGAFGLRGELKIEPLTDFWERFHKGARLRLQGDWQTVVSYREHKGRPLIKLTGTEDISAAEKLQWQYLEAIVEERPELDEDEFYVEDLIGLRVVTDEGLDLGVVDEVVTTPAHDLLQVGEALIPVVKEFILSVDLEEGLVTVHLIPGLLPGEE